MKKDSLKNSLLFWDTARDYLYHYMPDVRLASLHTVAAYKNGLNHFIDYLESEKDCKRKYISFADFNKENLRDFLDWMLNTKKLAPKTCNLRLTAIRSLLEHAIC